MQTDSFRITFRTSGADRAGAACGVTNQLRGLDASMFIQARRQLGRS
jgi:hypothetical protein